MIPIPPKFIEDTLNAYNIKFKHSQRKTTFQICNPFVQDVKYHMGLNYGKQVFHCFKTGDSGTMFDFFMRLLKIKEIELLRRIGDYEYQPLVVTEEEKIEIKPVQQPAEWVQIKGDSEIQKVHLAYLNRRNISTEMVLRNKFFVNTADIWRVIIPYYIYGKLVYWTARDITGKAKMKYVYPTKEECANTAGNLLYNFDFCDRIHLLLCEGQFNALMVNGVAVGGSNLTLTQLQMIRILNPKRLTVAFDQDKPGKTALLKIAPLLHQYFPDLYYVDAPLTKTDFADMGEVQAKEFIKKNSKPYSSDNLLRTAAFALL
jgi:DNA primase